MLKQLALELVFGTWFTHFTAMARMKKRRTDEASGSLFSFVDLEERISARHPLRKIRQVVNDALASLDAEFQAIYTDFGRSSIAPERLIYYRQGIAEQCHERGALGPPRGRAAVVGRSLFGRWHAGEGVRHGSRTGGDHVALRP